MGLYSILMRPFVRRMDADKASRVVLRYFRTLGKIPGWRTASRLVHNNRPGGLEREVFGLNFYNPVGLGAGLDMNGDLYNDLNDLGFSFVEIGPMTSLAQVRHAISNLQKDPQDDILGICIADNHYKSFCLAYDFCDFFVVELEDNLDTSVFDSILDARLSYDIYKPIVVKVPENICRSDLDSLAEFCMMNNVDGIEVRNLAQVVTVQAFTKGRLPIIANCHTISPEEAGRLFDAGASLVEVRSGLLFEGPAIVSRMLKYLTSRNK